MTKTSFLRFALLSTCSRPAQDRKIYRTIRQLKAATIVEIGVQGGVGSQRMIDAALRFSPANEIRYAGIDLFEARPADSPGLTLKEAHRTLRLRGVQIQLIPGDPFSALARAANTLTGTDLIVIRGDQDQEALERSWFYVPRMLHERSVVLRETISSRVHRFELMSQAAIEQWAAAGAPSRRAA